MGRIIALLGLCLIIAASSALAGELVYTDGVFNEDDWDEVVAVRGLPNGSGSGDGMQVGSGGNPGQYWEVTVTRDPDSAGPDNSTRLFSYNNEPLSTDDLPGYQACFTGEIDTLDISLDGIQFGGGSGGGIAPALRQGGVNYIAPGVSMPEQAWTERSFPGLTANSFIPIGSPNQHPDFSNAGGPITFGFAYAVSTPSDQTVMRTVGFDNWELRVDYAPLAPFIINAGLNDAWFNILTAGQGFFFTVFPDLGAFFLAWFTYDTERPGNEIIANLGDPGHRWLTAFGFYSGNSVLLDVELTSGGIFNSAEPAPLQEPAYGTITIVFHGCRCATLTYDFPSLGLTGTIPLQRIANDNVAHCEELNAEAALVRNFKLLPQ